MATRLSKTLRVAFSLAVRTSLIGFGSWSAAFASVATDKVISNVQLPRGFKLEVVPPAGEQPEPVEPGVDTSPPQGERP